MFEELRTANRRYAEEFALRDLPGRAAMGLALVTCMDTRIEPMSALGLRPGDAKVLRNAGGRVTEDVLRSLILATSLLEVSRVVVMHHTRCALAGCTEADLRSAVKVHNPVGPTRTLLAMPDPDEALAMDVNTVLACLELPRSLVVAGWRYDVDTGLVHSVIKDSVASDA
jgi:carbonic anhydrase